VVGAAEFLLRRDAGFRGDLSRLFLYKTTRKLLGWMGDRGAYLRETIKALRLFGTPPETQWPYIAELVDEEPSAFSYAYAKEFCNAAYLRLDSERGDGDDTLRRVKAALADGFPVVCGFPLNRSISLMGEDCIIPHHSEYEFDAPLGGHAVLCVGFDDEIPVTAYERDRLGKRGLRVPPAESKGALIIRNSWGPEWGNLGFAYLPYLYVRETLAVDFWTLLSETKGGDARARQAWREMTGAPPQESAQRTPDPSALSESPAGKAPRKHR
jgi:C1A family cysteine protease